LTHSNGACRPAQRAGGRRARRIAAILALLLTGLPAAAAAQDTIPLRLRPIPVRDTIVRLDSAAQRDSLRALEVEQAPLDSAAMRLAISFGLTRIEVFGRELFTRSTAQFQAVGTGPVDPQYRLGPGDQILLVLTGEVEFAHALEVTREGTIIVPQVGQVVVQGLTLPQLEDHLYQQLSRVFSGVGRGPGATTQFNASLGRLRASQVMLAGEVERPGPYQVSSVATVFTALYQARGPNVNGSFRNIEVRRGGELLQRVDVYDYLLRGDSRRDVRLEQGDIVFVPLAGRQVAVVGAVRRAAIYELREGEDLRDLLAFAGGVEASASVGRVQIDRILPPEQRRPGVDRVLIDVDLRDLVRGAPVPVQDRDMVIVFDVSTLRRNRMVLDGEVLRPGVYEWTPGTTLWSLIDRAEGLSPAAYTPRAHIYRLNQEDGSRFLVSATLIADSAGRRVADPRLMDADSVVIYSRTELRNPRSVSIHGWVKGAGDYALAEGMTVRDLILAAQGLMEGADPRGVEVVRRADPSVRTDTLARVTELTLGTSARVTAASPLETSLWIPSDQEFVLQHGDRVLVRRAPGYEPSRVVMVTGEVITPGQYALETRHIRLLDVLRQAGGPTTEADLAGLRVVRQGLPVGTDFARARRDPGGEFNLVLESGDSIVIPARDPTVVVTGAVGFESRVLYVPGRSLEGYIAQAGGYTRDADRGRVSVTYSDGERATVRRALFWSGGVEVMPGSIITVPTRNPEDRTDWGEVVTRVASVIGSAVTLWIAIDRLSQ